MQKPSILKLLAIGAALWGLLVIAGYLLFSVLQWFGFSIARWVLPAWAVAAAAYLAVRYFKSKKKPSIR